MAERDFLDQLADLFVETSEAHHRAYQDTEGTDPNWPQWYADYLLPRLQRLLNVELTRSELITLLVDAHKTHSREEPDVPWERYNARFLADRFVAVGQP